ncbi:hypothetical protein KY339_01690 [Candidatus Woesearchaeota archaeon]|nr:hypothetical protein [Candidatus Woesearchaeota archaeon]
MFAICVFGDSLIFGRGDNLNRGWVGRLRKYFEAKDYYNAVYNLGIPGNNTNDLLNRFETECKARIKENHPEDKHVILIGIGLNDSKYIDKPGNPEVKQEIFKKNIKQLIEIAKKYTPEVIFIGLTSVDENRTNPYETTFFLNDRVKQYNDMIMECCNDNNILFIDIFDEWQKLDYAELLDDGLHPNAKGYEKIYGIVKDFLIGHKIID